MNEEVKVAVARITTITKGGPNRLLVTRKNPDGSTTRFRGAHDDKLYVGDEITTSGDTFATFEFYTGGQIGINKTTTVRITGENRSEYVPSGNEGWGGWGRIREALIGINPLFIPTKPRSLNLRGGIIGIKG
ncbi:MAG: hypothetical protein L0Z50_14660 [Verrucomicrobiales bacterium]|nr:hypothetical protein [Verrucomicrobiales bacterium]